MRITKEEMFLAVALAIGGFILSSREFILWLNQYNPLQSLFIYYLMMYSALYVLAKFGLVIYKFKIDSPTKVLGLMMITFAFFIIIDWESCYINEVITGSCSNMSNIYFGSEDGATWWFWSVYMGITNIEYLRLLTYVFTPFALSLLGAYLVSEVRLF